MEFKHYSVLLNETIEQLHIRPDGIYVDGTLGGGGHSLEICRHLTTGRLIGIDQDADAIAAATERLKDYADRVTIVRSNYAQMADVLKNLGIEKVDGIILDLGVSSFQLDTPERGFTYRSEDAPLDMRMDTTRGETAAEWLARADEADLREVIKTYGEERFAKQIAAAIVATRAEVPLTTTGELSRLVAKHVHTREKGQDPATRTFQAIRIFINRELDELTAVLPQIIPRLTEGGRIAVISFHSLEDRIVKNFLRDAATTDTFPSWVPVRAADLPAAPIALEGKAQRASAAEVKANPRARSAIMRVATRTAGEWVAQP